MAVQKSEHDALRFWEIARCPRFLKAILKGFSQPERRARGLPEFVRALVRAAECERSCVR